MPIIECNNSQIYYEIHGKGPALILISGYTCDHATWELMKPELANHYTVVLCDNRAVGQTKDDGKPFSIGTMAEDIVQLSKALKLTQPTVAGQSMGGAIVQELGIKYANYFKKLIILNSVMKFSIASKMAMGNLLKLREQNASLDFIMDMTLPWIASSHFLADPANVRFFKEETKKNPYPQSLHDQKRQFDALNAFDASKQVESISLPTLVIAGKEDVITLPAYSKQLADAIPHATFELIDGAHASPMEYPQKVNELILNF